MKKYKIPEIIIEWREKSYYKLIYSLHLVPITAKNLCEFKRYLDMEEEDFERRTYGTSDMKSYWRIPIPKQYREEHKRRKDHAFMINGVKK